MLRQAIRRATRWSPHCLWLLLLACPLSAQDPPPFRLVTLDLNSRIVRGTLPFKEPFYMVGPAPAGARTITVKYKLGEQPAGGSVDCTVNTGWATPTATAWLRADKADTFYVHMPELQANQLYTICILNTVRPVGDALTAFRAEAAAVLDEVLRDWSRNPHLPNPLGPEQYRQVKVAFVKALAEQSGRSVHTDEQGGLFDITTGTLPASHGATLTTIVRKQLDRESEIQAFNLAPSGAPANPAFQHLVGNRLLQSFASGISTLKSLPGMSPDETMEAAATALYLHDLRMPVLPELLRGETRADRDAPRSTPMVAIPNVWTQAELEPRLENVGYTGAVLRTLRAAVSSVRGDASLLSVAGWTQDEANDLFTALQELIFAVEKQEQHLIKLGDHLRERSRLIELAASGATAEAQRAVALEGSSVLTFESRARSMVSADVGLAAVYGIGAVPYFGVNFYFEPVNKAIPLRFHGTAGDRFSLTLGITAQSITRSGEREDLFGSFGLLVGAGFRFADPLRVSVGGVALREVPDIPLDTRRPLRFSPYVSLSLDWDVRSTLGKFADKLF
jgi:hypothetical protein